MTLNILILINQRIFNLKRFIIINLNHTAISACLFYYSGIFITYSKSRLIYLQFYNKYKILFVLFIITLLLNLRLPPFFSFYGELLAYSSLVCTNIRITIIVILSILMTLLYTLFLINNIKNKNFIIIKLICYIFMFIFNIYPNILWIISNVI